MLDFAELTLRDIEKIRPYYKNPANMACDFTTGSILIWRDFFSMEYAEFNETLIIKVKVKYFGNVTAFFLPVGGDFAGSLREIGQYCETMGIPVTFYAVTEEELPMLAGLYSTASPTYLDADWSDYLYRASDLTNLAGRRYHGQKNHVNAFRAAHPDYTFEEITTANAGEVRDFFAGMVFPPEKYTDIFEEDHRKTLEVLDNFGTYGLPGGLIRVDGKVAAFSVGEVCGNVLYIHIEKADTSYKGIYQVVNNAFAVRNVTPAIEFINRAEDGGEFGLRTAKLSYHPCDMIHKYIVEVR